jgi:hypothetical protein
MSGRRQEVVHQRGFVLKGPDKRELTENFERR